MRAFGLLAHRFGRAGLLLAVVLSAACQTAPAPAPMAAEDPAAGLTATLVVADGGLEAGPETLTLALMDTAGQPVTEAEVSFSLDMTNMHMGEYVVPAPATAAGQYTAAVEFSMGGPWRLVAEVRRPGRPAAQLVFDFPVQE